MSIPFVTGLLFTKRRKAMEVVPQSLRTLWNNWELRGMVITSLALQGILTVIGSRRKYSRSSWVRLTLWLAYLSADTLATASLGLLSSGPGESGGGSTASHYVLTVFWAPFLILHLGGPDTISAYSLEDNELWLRHLLGLLVQVGATIYVFLTAWNPTNALAFVAIPIFCAGIVKYGERSWVLRSASGERFRDSIVTHPDPGPNYARFMEEYVSKKEEGFEVAHKSRKDYDLEREEHLSDEATEYDRANPEAAVLSKAYSFFRIFKKLPANLILTFHEIEKSQDLIIKSSYEEAFKVIEVELGFMFDAFYTKALLTHSGKGVILRLITFSCTLTGFVSFLSIEKHSYFKMDVIVTYILLVGALFLETYAVIVLIGSDWTIQWLSKHNLYGTGLLYQVVSWIPFRTDKRWSNALGQHSLLRHCLKYKPSKFRFIEVSGIDKLLENYCFQTSRGVSPELKRLIFAKVRDKVLRNIECANKSGVNGDEEKDESDKRRLRDSCADRGLGALSRLLEKLGVEVPKTREGSGKEDSDQRIKTLKGSVKEDFDQSLLLWHIATDLCHYFDRTEKPSVLQGFYHEASKTLSEYLLYLLVMRPFMMPKGIGEIRFRDTCAEAREFLQERESITNENQACSSLLEVSTEIPPAEVKGDRSKSVLFDGCRLAKCLLSLKKDNESYEQMWELISEVWVEMLCYAANQCGWRGHAKQLRKGGELLTHVWLLMAHGGLTEQYRIEKGHARVKLIVK